MGEGLKEERGKRKCKVKWQVSKKEEEERKE